MAGALAENDQRDVSRWPPSTYLELLPHRCYFLTRLPLRARGGWGPPPRVEHGIDELERSGRHDVEILDPAHRGKSHDHVAHLHGANCSRERRCTTAAPDNYELVETYEYDLAGTLTLQHTAEWNSGSGTLHDATKSYPSIDDKLSVVNRQIGVSAVSDETHAGHHAVYQENWYDALGRRVLVRAMKNSNCNSTTFGYLACKSYVERTVWDGDQVLIERRADGASGLSSGVLDQETTSGESWGEVVSLHANGIDAPIAVRKTGRTTLMPYANWKGDYELGTTADGTPTPLCSGTSDCPLIEWPGSQENADGLLLTHAALNTWWGSLINEKTDASGLKYMRNRYYNPQTGQFTQQDPIGLAGGINLYGFAAGDPVNFSDPFGLCPLHDVACLEDKMWAASGGTGIAGRLLAPLASTLLEISGASAVDADAKRAAAGSGTGMAMLAFDIGVNAIPGGGESKAALSALIKDAADNPGAWRMVGSFVEQAVNRKAKGGISIQTIIENGSGDRLVRHTVVDKAGKVIDDHFRDFFKPY